VTLRIVMLSRVASQMMETEPQHFDTDGDGLSDKDEADLFGTDHLAADTDGDGFSDADEVFDHGTDPSDPESKPDH